jgi:hypothetical protein
VISNLSSLSRALIMGLDKSTRPNAIAWTIVAIVVLALYGHASRGWTHIRKKLFEAFSPLIANADASPAVICVARIVGVLAALFHAHPCYVEGFVVMSCRAPRLGHHLREEAAATSSVAGFNSVGRSDQMLSAIAYEEPDSVAVWSPFTCWPNRNKTTKSLASDVNYFLCFGFAIPKMSEAARALFWEMWLPSLPLMSAAHAFGRDR